MTALASGCVSNNVSIIQWIKDDSDVSVDVMRNYMNTLKTQARSEY